MKEKILFFLCFLFILTSFPLIISRNNTLLKRTIHGNEYELYQLFLIINFSRDIYLPYLVKNHPAPSISYKPPLPAVTRKTILFYKENGEQINYTIFHLQSKPRIGYMALNVSKGEVIIVKILLTACSYKNLNSTVYLYVDIFADLDEPNNYTNYNITLYHVLRGWKREFIPSNIRILCCPSFVKLDPGESTQVEIKLKISEMTPSGIFPIYVSIDSFVLMNDTLYWYGSEETPYLLIVS